MTIHSKYWTYWNVCCSYGIILILVGSLLRHTGSNRFRLIRTGPWAARLCNVYKLIDLSAVFLNVHMYLFSFNISFSPVSISYGYSMKSHLTDMVSADNLFESVNWQKKCQEGSDLIYATLPVNGGGGEIKSGLREGFLCCFDHHSVRWKVPSENDFWIHVNEIS